MSSEKPLSEERNTEFLQPFELTLSSFILAAMSFLDDDAIHAGDVTDAAGSGGSRSSMDSSQESRYRTSSCISEMILKQSFNVMFCDNGISEHLCVELLKRSWAKILHDCIICKYTDSVASRYLSEPH